MEQKLWCGLDSALCLESWWSVRFQCSGYIEGTASSLVLPRSFWYLCCHDFAEFWFSRKDGSATLSDRYRSYNGTVPTIDTYSTVRRTVLYCTSLYITMATVFNSTQYVQFSSAFHIGHTLSLQSSFRLSLIYEVQRRVRSLLVNCTNLWNVVAIGLVLLALL